MFTGIIETTGQIKEIQDIDGNRSFWIESSLAGELKIDQSVSHNGVCLTVDQLQENMHRVTAIRETLEKTDLGFWEKEKIINLERCVQLNGRLDGHLVQGHVDCRATCTRVKEKKGSWEYTFRYKSRFAAYLIEKGSISVNGISLTAFNVTDKKFTVAIIPYTYQHTNLQYIKEGSFVNLEFDMVGKYINRLKICK